LSLAVCSVSTVFTDTVIVGPEDAKTLLFPDRLVNAIVVSFFN